eukprot:790004-Pyramimonas_sp.AAC.1
MSAADTASFQLQTPPTHLLKVEHFHKGFRFVNLKSRLELEPSKDQNPKINNKRINAQRALAAVEPSLSLFMLPYSRDSGLVEIRKRRRCIPGSHCRRGRAARACCTRSRGGLEGV